MNIQHNISLKKYTTFAVEVTADYFVEVENVDQVKELIRSDFLKEQTYYILGGGSNVLFTQDFKGCVVYNSLKGISVSKETEEYVVVDVAGGEDWHTFVMWSVKKGYWGIENLALIPGTVGAAPVQNIGAYGVEAKDTITQVRTLVLASGNEKVFSHAECQFAYRESLFKQEPYTYFVSSVQFKLYKKARPQLNYGAITELLMKSKKHENPSSADIAGVIIELRQSKLPNLGEIGMAGSFFKNPIITPEPADVLLMEYPDMKQYFLPDNKVKISAGWLIETMGYKGVKEGRVGTYDKHALVLVNHGGASGLEVWDFAQKIMDQAFHSFEIILEPEVLII
jgi:UDP-N-acetylmuramate dehydrogenase